MPGLVKLLALLLVRKGDHVKARVDVDELPILALPPAVILVREHHLLLQVPHADNLLLIGKFDVFAKAPTQGLDHAPPEAYAAKAVGEPGEVVGSLGRHLGVNLLLRRPHHTRMVIFGNRLPVLPALGHKLHALLIVLRKAKQPPLLVPGLNITCQKPRPHQTPRLEIGHDVNDQRADFFQVLVCAHRAGRDPAALENSIDLVGHPGVIQHAAKLGGAVPLLVHQVYNVNQALLHALGRPLKQLPPIVRRDHRTQAQIKGNGISVLRQNAGSKRHGPPLVARRKCG